MNWFKRLFRKLTGTLKSDSIPGFKYWHTPNWETATLKPPADIITFTSLSLDENGDVIRHADRGKDMYGNMVYRDEDLTIH